MSSILYEFYVPFIILYTHDNYFPHSSRFIGIVTYLERSNSASKFGIAIRPLAISERVHISDNAPVQPKPPNRQNMSR